MHKALLLCTLALVLASGCFADSQRDPYKVLGVTRQSSESDVRKAYRKLAIKLHPDKNTATASKKQFLEVQEAYETLSDPAKRAKYDRSGYTEQQAGSQSGNPGWNFGHPFQQHFQQFHRPVENIPSATTQLSHSNFQQHLFQHQTPLLIQVYYDYSPVCRAAMPHWEQAAKDLAPWVRLGRIEWGQQYLLETLWRFTGLKIRGEEVPAVFGYPASCLKKSRSISHLTCYIRYKGLIRADLLQHFAADKLLELPQVPAITRRNLDKFLAWVPHHKTTLLAFSKTAGASIALRQAAQQTDMLLAAGRVQWQNEDAGYWQERFGVQRAPALVFLRGPGVAPAVFDTSNSKRLDVGKLASDNQWQVVQPLRKSTADPLGCGWGSQADTSSLMQLCVVLVGRADSAAMTNGRAALALLSQWMMTHQGSMWHRKSTSAADAYAAGKLRLTWLDASTQRAFCRAHLAQMGSDTTSAVCGSNWASTLTPLLPTQLLWGAQNNKSSFIPLSSASWLPLQWLGYAHTMLHRWIALGYTTLLHWLGMDASAAVVTQTSAAAELRQVLSWKSCQQLIDSVSKHLVRLVHDPTTAWHEMKLLACFVWNAAPGTLLSIYETLSAIPGMLLPSLLRHPSQWPAAVQRSTAWKLVSSWQARLGRVLSQQPHRAGQVQLIAYKPGAGQLSAWWTRNHRYATYEGDAFLHSGSDQISEALAEWLSQCMASSGSLPHETGPPEQLVDDDALGWLGVGVQWGTLAMSWMWEQLPGQLPDWVTWETAQLVLPILVCALLALCAQVCSGQSHSEHASRSRHQQRRAARVQQADDEEDHDRFLHVLWKIDTEAVIVDTASHGANDSGKYLVMMLLRREHLIGSQQRQGQSNEAALSAANSNTCKSYLKQFAKLRASFKQDKRLVFGIAELHMLESVAWQRQYVSAVKEVKNACPVLVWHPKRTKFITLDCTLLQRAHMALEQVLDGNAKWLPTEWPN